MLSLFSNHWSFFLDWQGGEEYMKYQYAVFIMLYLSFFI